MMKTLRLTLVGVLIVWAGALRAQTAIETLQKQFEACVAAGGNKAECCRLWYQRTDSLLEATYQRLWVSGDSAQRFNMEDEREEWLEWRNAYFRDSYAIFKRRSPDDPSDMFRANIAFVNKRIQELVNSEIKHYSPAFFQVGITGRYLLQKEKDEVNAENNPYVTELKVRMRDNGSAYFWLRSHTLGADRDDITLMDTTRLVNNGSFYTYAVSGGSCSIAFRFTRRGVTLNLIREDEKISCGFGSILPVDGFYRRTSSKSPSDRELLKGFN